MTYSVLLIGNTLIIFIIILTTVSIGFFKKNISLNSNI